MANVYLMRHFESVAQLTPDVICGRSNDTPLSELGKLQGARAKRYMATIALRPFMVVASPARRAIETAQLVTDDNQPILIDERLQEMSQGSNEGKVRAEVYSPEQTEAFKTIGPDFYKYGGETVDDVVSRMRAAVIEVAAIADAEPNRDVLVVSHRTAIRALIANILNYPPSAIYGQPLENGSLSRIGVLPSGMYVDNINVSTQNIDL